MRRLSFLALAVILATKAFAVGTNAAPDFREVYELLRANLPDATDASLNQSAIAGLLAQFPGKVALVGADGAPAGPAVVQSSLLESNVAYLRLGGVAGDFVGDMSAKLHSLTASNKVAGVILDLRFAGGDDFISVPAAAKAIKTGFRPLAVLVNGQTRGAAESLAAELRRDKAGLLIGNPTAGEAAAFRELPLNNGQRLRIATASAQSGEAIAPDLKVSVNPAAEAEFFKNPYVALKPAEGGAIAATNSFLPFIDRTTEADLVRQRVKDGEETPEDTVREPSAPSLQDPALARAVDFIKALAVVGRTSS